MLKSISVQNYQSLEDVTVELGGLTVIVGPSNTGKSALIRAVQALCFNQSGTDFMTRGKDKTSITIEADGNTVNWTKGKSAAYDLNGQSYSRMGTTVPVDIQEALGIRRVDVDSLTLFPQFASQFDTPFLLTESSRKAAQVLARITRLDIVLSAMIDVKKDTTKTKQNIEQLSKEIENKEEEYNNRADEWDARLTAWEEVRMNCDSLVEKYNKTKTLAEKLEQYTRLLAVEKPKVSVKQLNELVAKINKLKVLKDKHWDLEGITVKHYNASQDITELKEYIALLESMLQECPTCGALTRKKNASKAIR